jgi:hypothetical protein
MSRQRNRRRSSKSDLVSVAALATLRSRLIIDPRKGTTQEKRRQCLAALLALSGHSLAIRLMKATINSALSSDRAWPALSREPGLVQYW